MPCDHISYNDNKLNSHKNRNVLERGVSWHGTLFNIEIFMWNKLIITTIQNRYATWKYLVLYFNTLTGKLRVSEAKADS